MYRVTQGSTYIIYYVIIIIREKPFVVCLFWTLLDCVSLFAALKFGLLLLLCWLTTVHDDPRQLLVIEVSALDRRRRRCVFDKLSILCLVFCVRSKDLFCLSSRPIAIRFSGMIQRFTDLSLYSKTDSCLCDTLNTPLLGYISSINALPPLSDFCIIFFRNKAKQKSTIVNHWKIDNNEMG